MRNNNGVEGVKATLDGRRIDGSRKVPSRVVQHKTPKQMQLFFAWSRVSEMLCRCWMALVSGDEEGSECMSHLSNRDRTTTTTHSDSDIIEKGACGIHSACGASSLEGLPNPKIPDRILFGFSFTNEKESAEVDDVVK